MDELDTPAKRLKWARERDNRYSTATAAAKAHGWTVPTYLGHENGDRNPSRNAAIKYARAYKVPWEWILEGGPLPDKKGSRIKTGPILTRGEVAAGRWLDLEIEVDPRDFEQYPVAADPGYPRDAQYGLIVRGTSINRIAADGDVLHCLDLGIVSLDVEDDDLIIAERRRAQAGQKEVTAKRIHRRGRMIILSPDSFDAKWKPIEFDGKNKGEDEEVAVIAKVLGIYKPLRKRKRP
jgi:SOS-response transcriptional repressor LexA